jgi:hypothetical protein
VNARELEELKADGRHPATVQLAGHFEPRAVAEPFRDYAVEIQFTARTMIRLLPDCPELTVGLRKLLEARDCFVRAASGEAASS